MKIIGTLSAEQQLTGSLNPENQIYGDMCIIPSISSLSILRFPSLSAFPSLGSEKFLYVATDTSKSYIWEEGLFKYSCVGSNYEDINVIDGGDASE